MSLLFQIVLLVTGLIMEVALVAGAVVWFERRADDKFCREELGMYRVNGLWVMGRQPSKSRRKRWLRARAER